MICCPCCVASQSREEIQATVNAIQSQLEELKTTQKADQAAAAEAEVVFRSNSCLRVNSAEGFGFLGGWRDDEERGGGMEEKPSTKPVKKLLLDGTRLTGNFRFVCMCMQAEEPLTPPEPVAPIPPVPGQ